MGPRDAVVSNKHASVAFKGNQKTDQPAEQKSS